MLGILATRAGLTIGCLDREEGGVLKADIHKVGCMLNGLLGIELATVERGASIYESGYCRRVGSELGSRGGLQWICGLN